MKKLKKEFILLLCTVLVSINTYAQYWYPKSTDTIVLKNNNNNLTPLYLGVGTEFPSAQTHTTGTVRLEGLVDTKDSFVVVTDINGNINREHIDSLLKGKIPSLGSAWLLTGNVVTPTDYIGTNNPDDFRIRTSGALRGRYTLDGNYELGTTNTFNNSTITHLSGDNNVATDLTNIFMYGSSNNSNVSNNGGVMGINNTPNLSAGFGIMGSNNSSDVSTSFGIMGDGNRVDTSRGVVALGQACSIISSEEGGVIGEDLNMRNCHGAFMAGGHSFLNPSAPGMFGYNISLGALNTIDASDNSHTYGNNNVITGGANNFIFGNGLSILSGVTQAFAFGADISNDLGSSMKFGFNNNRTMTIAERGTEIQMNPGNPVYSPSHNLEVMAGSASGTVPEIVFQDLPTTTNSYDMVVINPINFELYRMPNCCSSGISSSCSTQYMVPRVNANGSPDLTCSQIYDNGTSVGIGTTSPRTYTGGSAAAVIGPPALGTVSKLDVNGLTFTNTLVVSSDARLKKEIKPIQNALETVSALEGVTYTWENEKYKERNLDKLPQAGFLAQDVEKVYPRAVVKDNEGFYAMNYNAIIPLLTEAIKDQQKQIESKNQQIAKLQNALDDLAKTVDQVKNDLNTICNKGCAGLDRKSNQAPEIRDVPSYLSRAWLGQNFPNPHSGRTSIKYFIPNAAQKAVLKVLNLQGKIINTYALDIRAGHIELDDVNLVNGLYLYTLVVDNIQIDTKRMTIEK